MVEQWSRALAFAARLERYSKASHTRTRRTLRECSSFIALLIGGIQERVCRYDGCVHDGLSRANNIHIVLFGPVVLTYMVGLWWFIFSLGDAGCICRPGIPAINTPVVRSLFLPATCEGPRCFSFSFLVSHVVLKHVLQNRPSRRSRRRASR